MLFLIHFAQSHPNFRLAELDALSQLHGIPIAYDKDTLRADRPFFYCDIPTCEQAQLLVSRSVLIKDIILPFETATSLPQLLTLVKHAYETTTHYQQYEPETVSFKFNIIAYNHTVSKQDQLDIIESFSFFKFKGPIDLKQPRVTFMYLEDWGSEPFSTQLYQCWFGVHIGSGNRAAILQFDLKKREYLGNTSMDPELSLLMANMALARKGSLVLDPFVGTGSFLLTCSYFGAFTMGSDIDGKQIRGRNAYEPLKKKMEKKSLEAVELAKLSLKENEAPSKRMAVKMNKNEKQLKNEEKWRTKISKSIVSNVVQYGLQGKVLGTLVTDAVHHPWRSIEIWDAIVCDPPYGVRAGAKKIGENHKPAVFPSALKPDGTARYPKTVPYEMDQVLIDLLDFAAIHLVPGGRLVYWLPTITENYSDQDVPMHPQFKLVSNCEQCFGKWSRRLITMEKLGGSATTNTSATSTSKDSSLLLPHQPAHAGFRASYFRK